MSHLIQYGTYTPVVTLSGAGTAPQYSTASGTWTIVGRLCFVDIQLIGDGGNEGSGAGQILVSLPFIIGTSQLPVNIMAGSSINGIQETLLYATLTSGLQTAALTSAFTTTYSGIHYLGIMVAATTVPTLKGNTAKTGGQLNAAAPSMGGTSSTGLTTTLPSPAAAPGTVTTSFWGCVS